MTVRLLLRRRRCNASVLTPRLRYLSGGPAMGLLRMLNGAEEGAKISRAQAIFRGCEAQSTRPALRTLVDPTETGFATEQALLVLHVWITQRHLLARGERGTDYQDELFATLWDNTTYRIRALGVDELLVNKRLDEVQKWSLGACMAYDEGLVRWTEEGDGAKGDNASLDAALWRNVWQGKGDAVGGDVALLREYVLEQLEALSALSDDELFRGYTAWDDPPVAPDGRGEPATPQDAHGDGMLDDSGAWRRQLNIRGEAYWWHVASGAATWDLEDGKAALKSDTATA